MTTLTAPPPKTAPRRSIIPLRSEPNGNELKFLKRIGHSNVETHPDDVSAFFYEAGLDIDADGAPHAYHPDGRSGLDYLGNAGRPGNWWALVTDNGEPSGRPIIQGANDPAPGFYISTTSLEDPNWEREDTRRYVNAEAINFIVLPGRLGLGAELGDLAVVIHPETGVHVYAVYADVGPANKIGEASIALANAIGIPSSPKTGGIGHGIGYIVFPGSAQHWPLSQQEIDQNSATLFAKWGGIEKAKVSLPQLNWA
jgi:hypothetical protein